MFAIVESGGKQYRVAEGDVLRVEKLAAESGAEVDLPVLLLGGDEVVIGTPHVKGVRVVAEVIEHGRGPKLDIYKFKAKNNYRRHRGHRQPYTDVRVTRIEGAGGSSVAAPRKASVEAEPGERAADASAAKQAGADMAGAYAESASKAAAKDAGAKDAGGKGTSAKSTPAKGTSATASGTKKSGGKRSAAKSSGARSTAKKTGARKASTAKKTASGKSASKTASKKGGGRGTGAKRSKE